MASAPIFNFVTLAAIGAAVVAALIAKVAGSALLQKNSENSDLRDRLKKANELIKLAKVDLANAEQQIEHHRFEAKGLLSLVDESTSLFPWIISAKSELLDIFAMRAAEQLATKKHPAV